MEGTFDAELQPNIAAELRGLATPRQWSTGKGWGYASLSALWSSGNLQPWLRGARAAMDRAGLLDMMMNAKLDGNDTVVQVITHMRPPPRAIVHKHSLVPGAGTPGPATAQPFEIGGTVVLHDPVLAPKDAAGDIDVSATVTAVVKSATRRRFFWVFLDHTSTVQHLEQVLRLLPPSVVPVNIDELVRLYQRDRKA